jgi:hypothetical protein
MRLAPRQTTAAGSGRGVNRVVVWILACKRSVRVPGHDGLLQLIIFFTLAMGSAAHAAAISVQPAANGGPAIVTIDGDLEANDGDQFRSKTGFLSKAISLVDCALAGDGCKKTSGKARPSEQDSKVIIDVALYRCIAYFPLARTSLRRGLLPLGSAPLPPAMPPQTLHPPPARPTLIEVDHALVVRLRPEAARRNVPPRAHTLWPLRRRSRRANRQV